MQHARPVSIFVAGILVFNLAACATESTPSVSQDAQAVSTTDTNPQPGQLPDSDIQERGLSPRLKPSVGSQIPSRPIQLAPTPLPGAFAIQTFNQNFVTAVDGGGRTTNVLHTDARGIGAWEQFKLLGGSGFGEQYAFQTMKGTYLTAVNGGGLSNAVLPNGQPTDPLHTDATQVQSWETFKIVLDQYGWRNAIQTVNGHYLTAVGAGGKTTDAFHTDAVKPNSWEQFYLWKCGDLGSGYQYAISALNGPSGVLFAYGGGGHVATHPDIVVTGALGVLSDYNARPQPFDNAWQRFRLIRQGDGSYALQTSNGINYVTAVKGGGLPHGTISYDSLVTDRTQVQAWETFRFVEHGACTYVIQTVGGYYLGKSTAAPGTALGWFATNVQDINAATKFRLLMVF